MTRSNARARRRKASQAGSGKDTLRFFALGGLGEIGKNMYVLECGDDIVVVDSGLMFPDEEMLGIDFVIPDISYLEENKHRIRGLVLTHGHEDHIGALPFVLPKLDVPLYGTCLTLGMAQGKLAEVAPAYRAKLNEVKAGDVAGGLFGAIYRRVSFHPRRRGAGHPHPLGDGGAYGGLQVRCHPHR